MLQYAERAQGTVLAGLANAKVWERGELAFQGGTSLHMAYGSPRFSEDLDFVVQRGLVPFLDGVMAKASEFAMREMRVSPDWVWTLKDRDAGRAVEEIRNPRVFTISMQAPEWGQAVKVKIEFWAIENDAFIGYDVERKVLGPRFQDGVAMEQAALDVATLPSIAVDKIWAIAGRDRTKARDWFDLWWMKSTQNLTSDAVAAAVIAQASAHEKMYVNDPRHFELADILERRAQQVNDEIEDLAADLKRWLMLAPELAQNTAPMVKEAIGFVTEILEKLRKITKPK